MTQCEISTPDTTLTKSSGSYECNENHLRQIRRRQNMIRAVCSLIIASSIAYDVYVRLAGPSMLWHELLVDQVIFWSVTLLCVLPYFALKAVNEKFVLTAGIAVAFSTFFILSGVNLILAFSLQLIAVTGLIVVTNRLINEPPA